jgi:rhodanese-related sulfurtransferase
MLDKLFIKNIVFLQKKILMNLEQHDWISKLNADPKAIILDVRTDDEYKEGIIANAINIDIHSGQEFVEAIEALDKDKNYFVYCRSGMRSAKACEIMNQLGFENAYNLTGGIVDWEGEVVTP